MIITLKGADFSGSNIGNLKVKYIDITTQGSIKGQITSAGFAENGSSLYYITKCQIPDNAIQVEYQAFPTGSTFGSGFFDDSGNLIKALPKTGITVGDRVTETIPSGATWFYHMWMTPAQCEASSAPTFDYIRFYSIEGNTFRITKQEEASGNMLNVSDGTVSSVSDSGGGVQTITIITIPRRATSVNYQVFKTGANYGSGFFDASGKFISGYANKTAVNGTRYTLNIPSNATTFYFMYPNSKMAQANNYPAFDYVEFTLEV